jgi:hypothetical protein
MSEAEKLYAGSADLLLLLLMPGTPGRSLERRVSNHAGSSGIFASGAAVPAAILEPAPLPVLLVKDMPQF